MITIKLKDGSALELPEGANAFDAALKISEGLSRNVFAAEVNGETRDLRTVLQEGDSLNLLTFNDEAGREAMRHTASHILAQAVKRLYPSAKLSIGPAIENGFYYDFDVEQAFTPEDLVKIEAEMNKIVKEKLPITRFTLSRTAAIEKLKNEGEMYKVSLIEDLPVDEEISFYSQGEFTDLCAGPHAMDTGKIKSLKLLNTTGAYFRGDAKNKMLCRVYGTAFTKKDELKAYLTMLEEARKRDHRKIGKELGLFMLIDEGPGFPFFLPKGMIVKNLLVDYWREVHTKANYHEIATPIMLTRSLWERSGHWDHYKDNMYTTQIDENDFAVKPMNCPGGILVYKSAMHSYRDLPLRMGELGIVHRHELSGALHGLMRVRCFTQDDAHIFMTKDQIKDEIIGVTKLIDEVYSMFGFDYHIELSTMPEDHMGEIADWEHATNSLKEALEELQKDFVINEGDGAFYGPKIDFHLKDCLGRTWQCGTIQLDFQLPERFELEYVGADGEKHRPVMIHRVAFGSIERFIGILTEHFAGAFPLWLSPVQAVVMPITDRARAYAQGIVDRMKAAGYRVELDGRNEKIGYKIREAQVQKIPYMLIIGDREAQEGTVSVRTRTGGDLGAMQFETFLEEFKAKAETRSLD